LYRAKKHFEARPTVEKEWVPACRIFPERDLLRLERPTGCRKLDPIFPNKEHRPAKSYIGKSAQSTAEYGDALRGIVTFVEHNRKTINEVQIEAMM
jgi:hypothetical protein